MDHDRELLLNFLRRQGYDDRYLEEHGETEVLKAMQPPAVSPITEDWLRGRGFKWEQFDRQPSKHWTLKLGAAVSEGGRMIDPDQLILELARCQPETPDDLRWFAWLRADYCGRYTRFVHVRHVRDQEEVVTLIAALTGFPFDPANCWYGGYYKPEHAAMLRKDSERLEVRMAREWGKRVEHGTGADPDKREALRP